MRNEYQQGRVDMLDEIEGKISEITWYHISDGVLLEGANSDYHEPLYKNSDIERMFKQIRSNMGTGDGDLF